MDKKWTEILSNEELVKKMAEINEPEKFQEFFKSNGYDFSLEEINALGEELAAQYSELSKGELNENDLEDVAGGTIITPGKMIRGIAAAAKNLSRCRRW